MFILIIFSIVYSQKTSLTIQLFGNSKLGYYYTNLYIGSTSQKQSLLVDTSSSFTNIGCNDFENHLNPPYKLNSSTSLKLQQCDSKQCSSCQDGQCQFILFDSEGSYISGVEFIDRISFYQDNDQVEILLGCAYHVSDALNQSILNGVLALAPNTTNNLIKKYYDSKIVNSSKFSLCLGKNNGYMSIGEYDRSKHLKNQEIQQSNILPISKEIHGISDHIYSLEESSISKNQTVNYQGETNFNIQIKKIIVNNQIVVNTNDIPIDSFIDSGATYLFAYPELAKTLQDQFTCSNYFLCSKQEWHDQLPCYLYSAYKHNSFEEFSKLFPTYYFLIANFTLEWTPLNYLTRSSSSKEIYCLPVYAYDFLTPQVRLGQVWMRNYDIQFDLDNKLITFYKSQCDTQIQESNNIILFIVFGVLLACLLLGLFLFFYCKRKYNTAKSFQISRTYEQQPEQELEEYLPGKEKVISSTVI